MDRRGTEGPDLLPSPRIVYLLTYLLVYLNSTALDRWWFVRLGSSFRDVACPANYCWCYYLPTLLLLLLPFRLRRTRERRPVWDASGGVRLEVS